MMAKKSERGRKALAAIAEASGVSQEAVIKVLTAAANSKMATEAMEFAAGSHSPLQEAVNEGVKELGLNTDSIPAPPADESVETETG